VKAGLSASRPTLRRIRFLERGTLRDVHLVFLTVDPTWDACRSDSRFEALLSDCGFIRDTDSPGLH
jgi:hypothetical protein